MIWVKQLSNEKFVNQIIMMLKNCLPKKYLDQNYFWPNLASPFLEPSLKFGQSLLSNRWDIADMDIMSPGQMLHEQISQWYLTSVKDGPKR